MVESAVLPVVGVCRVCLSPRPASRAERPDARCPECCIRMPIPVDLRTHSCRLARPTWAFRTPRPTDPRGTPAGRWHAGRSVRRRPTAFVLLLAAALAVTAAVQRAEGDPGPGAERADGRADHRARERRCRAARPGAVLRAEAVVGRCAPFASGDDRAALRRRPLRLRPARGPARLRRADGRTAQLGVLRLKATGQRIGSLVVNPGGPGVSGMSALPALFGTGPGAAGPLPKRFDVVGLDPRGVGASTPTIDCLTDAERDVERTDLDVDPSPSGIAATERRTSSTPSAARSASARMCWRTSAPATRPATSTSCAPRSATRS